MMSDTVKALLLIVVFILYVSAPLWILLVVPQPEGREVWREFSVALGFAGLALIGFQFIPTARLPFLSSLFPMDTLYVFHHNISAAGFFLGMVHPLLLFIGAPATLGLLNLVTAPWRARAAVIGVIVLLLLMVTSVWREALKLKYETWRTAHDLFAVAAAGLVLFHMFAVNYHMAHPLQQAYWIFSAALWGGATVYTRLLRPIQLLRKPYRVVSVEPRRGNVCTLVVQPDGHAGLRFRAGQFAWITARTSPFSFRDNPFSFSSSAENTKELRFTVQMEGESTKMLHDLQPGEQVYIDGPVGTFGIHRHDDAPGFVMIGGGIGSAPLMSILRTMIDRQDPRPVIFFYGNPDLETLVYREELEEIDGQMNLTMVHVLENPPEGWQGETGFITADIMQRYLPEDYQQLRVLMCGPIPMINAVDKELARMKVPRRHIYTEKYEMA